MPGTQDSTVSTVLKSIIDDDLLPLDSTDNYLHASLSYTVDWMENIASNEICVQGVVSQGPYLDHGVDVLSISAQAHIYIWIWNSTRL